MKKLTILSLAILAFALVCCNQKSKETSNPEHGTESCIVFDTLKLDKSFPLLANGKEAPNLQIKIKLLVPASDNKEVVENMSNSIAYTAFGFEGLTLQESVDSLVSTAKKDYYELRSDYINEKGAEPTAPYFYAYYQLASKVSQGPGHTICYTISCDTYNGGAHPLEIISTINFDTTSGKEIALQDILKENSDSLLTTKLTTRLAQQHGLSTLEELQGIGFLTMSDMYVTNNFVLAPDSLFFIYNNYEIAPYALGKSCIGFTYDELKDILK